MGSSPPGLADLPPLREVIAQHGLAAKKSLGQHFLLDLNLTRKIARSAGDLTQLHVIEVGSGPGGLTRGILLEGAHHLTAIETDARAIAALQHIVECCGNRCTLVHADALTVDMISLVPAPRAIVANLPYNIGTELLFRWLADIDRHGPDAYCSLTLMFQKEVAERIIAPPGNKIYGKLSVMCQFLCDAHYVDDIPASAFVPPPKVISTVIRLVPKRERAVNVSWEQMNKVVSAAFGQRRKMLRASLKPLGIDTDAWLETAGIDGTRRAETLSVLEFGRLAQLLSGFFV